MSFTDDILRGEQNSIGFDAKTFFVVLLLTSVGLVSIYSATYEPGGSAIFYSQLTFAIIGVVLMLVLAFMPEGVLQFFAYPLYGLGLLMLGAVLMFGTVRNGAKGWFILGPISFQPAEVAKFFTLIATSRIVALEGRSLSNWRDIGLLLLIIMLPVGLIMLEPDFGSASVYMAMMVGIALWAGADLFLIFAIVTPIAVAVCTLLGSTQMYICLAVVFVCMIAFRRSVMVTILGFLLSVSAGFSTNYIYQNVLQPHQQNRIRTFLNPDLDPKGAGYHVLQSLLAVGSGGITGKGFLKGTQTQLRYIPEQWTDFIFCVPTEEFGLVGGVLVLLLLGCLMFFAITTAKNLRNRFASTICVGVATIFFYHTCINVGMAIGLVPVMGIPLPFLSKGGSSLMLNMAMAGLVMNFYRYRTDVRKIDL